MLVVDDQPMLRRYTSRILRDAGYNVLLAGNGIDALGLLRQSRLPVKLVITDIEMPGMDGPTLAGRVAHEPYPPAVLFVSGAYGYLDLPGPLLAKPFSAHQLIEVVQLMLTPVSQPATVARTEAAPSWKRWPDRASSSYSAGCSMS
ncbi:MAG: response regulator [Gemmatimonadales bacterium]